MMTRTTRPHPQGFTLIEVLVALVAMALMAGLGWRGVDGLLRAREASQTRVDQMAVMQTALAQWQSDLDTALSVPGNPALPGLSWDGRVLRIVRRASVPDLQGADAGLWVVSWTVRTLSPDEAAQIGQSGQNPPLAWVRTQAPASTDRQILQQYWTAAGQGGSGLASTAVLFPVQQWQLFYFRRDAWSNPLSSSGTVSAGQDATIPDAVRLHLVLPEGMSPSGTLTLDWVRPDFSTVRS